MCVANPSLTMIDLQILGFISSGLGGIDSNVNNKSKNESEVGKTVDNEGKEKHGCNKQQQQSQMVHDDAVQDNIVWLVQI